MRPYTILFTLLLNFATALSYLVYAAGLPIAQQTLAIKDVLLLLGAVASIISMARRALNNDLHPTDWLIIAVLTFNMISLFISPAPAQDRILNFRRNISFLTVFLVFREFGSGFKNPLAIFNITKIILLIIWTFGVIEYLLPDYFWNNTIGISNYWRAITFDPFATDTIGESGRFYSWDLISITEEPIRRMVSIYFEPTTLAAFFSACFCMSLAKREWTWTVTIALIGCLTISKFFVLSILSSVIIFYGRDHLKKNHLIVVIGISMLASMAILALELESGALLHLKGITSLFDIIQQKNWFGLGLGAAGNYSDSELDTAEIGAESGFGNIVAQLGIGVIIYVLLLNSIYISLLQCYRKQKDPIYASAICALICWSISFMLSASSMGMSGNAFFFIFIGTVLYHAKKESNYATTPSVLPYSNCTLAVTFEK